MKTVLTNFIYTFRKFKVSSILNILGLTAAFAAFLVIGVQVYFEYSFEKYHPNFNRIFRVDIIDEDNGESWAIHSHPFIRAIQQSSPHIIGTTLINPFIDNFYITVDDGGKQKGFKESFITCDAEITSIFNFRFLEGQRDCLKKPENVIISKSVAEKLFGNRSAIGQRINLTGSLWSKQDKGFLVVGGVYENFPENTQLKNCIYTAIDPGYDINSWNSNYICYVLLDKDTSPDYIVENFERNFDFSKLQREIDNIGIILRPITSLYFMNSDPSGRLIKGGSPTTPILLLTISILIIIIAVINYTNFNMTLAPMRMRSINTRKILGSTNTALRFGLIGETVVLSLLSYILAILVVVVLDKGNVLSFIKADISIENNLLLVFITGLVAILTGIIAGIRPAFYMTSYSPALAIKGNFGLSFSGRKLRTVLIGFQFFISIVLIVVSFFIYKQNLYMQKYTLGYDADNIALVELSYDIVRNNKNELIAKIKDNPDIIDVAFSQQKFGAGDTYRTWGGRYEDEDIHFYSLSVSPNFLKVMGIPVTEGRMPDESIEKDSEVYYLPNATFKKAHNLEIGGLIDISGRNSPDRNYGRIIGFVDDVKFRSLRNESGNMVFAFNESIWQIYSYIRIRQGADIKAAVAHIEKSISAIDATYPANVEFYDEIFDNLYKQEIKTETIITVFSLLAIIISIVGVFGLVMFECEYRKKEIAIRKTLGSNEAEILSLFNKNYLIILCACFLLSVPISYYIINRWLESFAYRTSLDWWAFLLAGIPVMLITLLTVTWQSWKAAVANPVDALKNE